MSFKAKYSTGSKTIPNARIRIKRIWGSEEEGWNATVCIYEQDTSLDHSDIFHFHVPYTPGLSPVELLYGELGRLGLFKDVQHDVATEFNAVTIDHLVKEVPQEEPPKKTKKKK
jgi:hypothetical protein